MTHEEIILFTDFLGYNYIGSHEKEKYEDLRTTHNEKIKPIGTKLIDDIEKGKGYKRWVDIEGEPVKNSIKMLNLLTGKDFYPGWYANKTSLPFKHSFSKKNRYPSNHICRAKWFIDFKNFNQLFKILDKLSELGYTYDLSGKGYGGLHRCEIRAGVSHQLGSGEADTALEATFLAVKESLKALKDEKS